MEKFSEKAVNYVANFMRLLESTEEGTGKQALKDSIIDYVNKDVDRIGLDVYEIVNRMLEEGKINKSFIEYAIKTQTKRLSEFMDNTFVHNNEKISLKQIFRENFVELAKKAIQIKETSQEVVTTFNELLTPKGNNGSKLSTSIVNTFADALRFASYNETEYANSTGRGEFLLDLFFNDGTGSKISMEIIDLVGVGLKDEIFNIEVKSTDTHSTFSVALPEEKQDLVDTDKQKKKRYFNKEECEIVPLKVFKEKENNPFNEKEEWFYTYPETGKRVKLTKDTNGKYYDMGKVQFTEDEKSLMIKTIYEAIDERIGDFIKKGKISESQVAKADISLPKPIDVEYKNSYAARTLFFLIGGEHTFRAASQLKHLTSDNKILRTEAIYGILGMQIRLINVYDAVRQGIIKLAKNKQLFHVYPNAGVTELNYNPTTGQLELYKKNGVIQSHKIDNKTFNKFKDKQNKKSDNREEYIETVIEEIPKKENKEEENKNDTNNNDINSNFNKDLLNIFED